MKVSYDSAKDLLTILLSPTPSVGPGQPAPPDVLFLHDGGGKIVGIQIEDARARVDPAVTGLAVAGDEPENSIEAADDTQQMDADESPSVIIFSDGACSGNPGPGGWAARLKYPDGRVRELGGFVADTTNNRMELQAAIQGLKAVVAIPSVTLVTDSEYVRKGITGWIHGWKRRNWLTAAKKPVLNQDLWRELDALNRSGISWKYTPGHAGDPDNERCDEIAQSFSRGGSPDLLDH
jgi:ribonuclease HI